MRITKMGSPFPPAAITPAYLNVVVMPNGEIICLGKTVGWLHNLSPYVYVEVPDTDGVHP
jgi:hypothetical protein